MSGANSIRRMLDVQNEPLTEEGRRHIYRSGDLVVEIKGAAGVGTFEDLAFAKCTILETGEEKVIASCTLVKLSPLEALAAVAEDEEG